MEWVTVFNRTSTTGEYTDSATRQHRDIVAANLASLSGTKVRITLMASSTTDAVIGGSSMGESTSGDDFDASPTRITWDGGSSSTTITANQSKISDAIDFSFDKSKRYLIHLYETSRNLKYATDALQDYWSSDAVDRTMTTSVTFSGPANAVYVRKLEVYSAIPGSAYKSSTIAFI